MNVSVCDVNVSVCDVNVYVFYSVLFSPSTSSLLLIGSGIPEPLRNAQCCSVQPSPLREKI